jgi:hypothetical protein
MVVGFAGQLEEWTRVKTDTPELSIRQPGSRTLSSGRIQATGEEDVADSSVESPVNSFRLPSPDYLYSMPLRNESLPDGRARRIVCDSSERH